MEFDVILDWVKGFVCENPFWSVFGAIFTPTALIQLRKYYLDYFSSLKVEFTRLSISLRNNRRIAQPTEIYFTIGIKIYNKTRKRVHLSPVECRIITDSIPTRWHQCEWSNRRLTIQDSPPIAVEISFFEANYFNVYQFEIRLKEDGTKKEWTKKSSKYVIENSQLVELK